MSDNLEKDEIFQIWTRLQDEAGAFLEAHGELADVPENPVNEWLAAREVDEEDLMRYASASAAKILKELFRTGMITQTEIASSLAEAFQIGFEVAAKRYLSTPPASPLH